MQTPLITDTARRLLLINPNTNALTTQRLQQVLQPLLPAQVQLDIRTARFGANYIACEASHAVAAHACLEAWASYCVEEQNLQNLVIDGAVDGVLIGCFGDPGLFALREASACRVTGLAEASFIQAAKHGPFSIVTGGERWKPMLTRLAQSLGYGDLLRHIETVTPSGAALQADPQMAIRCLTSACEQAAQYDVQSIILGGAGLAGYAQKLQHKVTLPLIDSAVAGLHVMLQDLAPAATKSTNGFFANWHQMSDAFTGLNETLYPYNK